MERAGNLFHAAGRRSNLFPLFFFFVLSQTALERDHSDIDFYGELVAIIPISFSFCFVLFCFFIFHLFSFLIFSLFFFFFFLVFLHFFKSEIF